jgi:hypothetical protein
VALTRQRESAQVFVAEETARDIHQLARQMVRGEVRAASVAWAIESELAPALRQRAKEGQGTGKPRQPDNLPVDRALRPKARTKTPLDQGAPAGGWLIPPQIRPDGSDSLGRGLDADSIAAAVAASAAVQREREARWSYLQGAYADPYAARAALDMLVRREGWTSAAARIARAPEQLRELRGKAGWLVSAAAKQERAGAERAAGALPASLTRIAEAEARAERAYRSSVEARRAADATGIPRLSTAAEAAIAGLGAASDEKTRAEAWAGLAEGRAGCGRTACVRGGRYKTVRGRRRPRHAPGDKPGSAGHRVVRSIRATARAESGGAAAGNVEGGRPSRRGLGATRER